MRLVTTFTLSLLLAGTLAAQPCDPEQTTEACPDTTDWRRYMPLAVGNEWQFREAIDYDEIVHWGWRITGEAEAGGRTYFKLEHCDAAEDGTVTCGEPSLVRYDDEYARIVQYGEEGDTWWTGVPCRLDLPFDGMPETDLYECEGGSFERYYGTWGEYDATWNMPPDVVSGDTRKHFGVGAMDGVTLYAGIGLVRFYDEYHPEATRLVYARIDGEALGTSAFATCDPSDPDGIPCPDTTDWRRYFPLEVGNAWQYRAEEWQYEFYSFGYQVLEVDAVDGVPHFMVRRCEDPLVGDFYCEEPVAVRYDDEAHQVMQRVEDGTYEPWLGFQAPLTRTLSVPLNAPFCDHTCVCEAAECDDESGPFVAGVYGEGWKPYWAGDTEKQFFPNISLIHFDFVAGVGLVYETNGLDEANLVYAELGGVEYGTSLFDFPTAGEPGAAPVAFALRSVYPNPAREATTVAFTLDRPQVVTLEVLDVLGRVVSTEAVGPQAAGPHEVRVSTGTLPSGLYLVRLRGEDREAVRRLVVLR